MAQDKMYKQGVIPLFVRNFLKWANELLKKDTDMAEAETLQILSIVTVVLFLKRYENVSRTACVMKLWKVEDLTIKEGLREPQTDLVVLDFLLFKRYVILLS